MAERPSGKNHRERPGGAEAQRASGSAARPAGHKTNHHGEWFSRFAHETARLTGKPAAFILAAASIVIWAVTGPLFNYSDTWQLVINTSTTIVTFLMVFLIQNTQNRDTLALQVKLSELIIAVRGAHNRLATAEDLTEEELERLHKEYCSKADSTMETLEQLRAAAKRKRT
jgi:low affinity Fe/Cu permease